MGNTGRLNRRAFMRSAGAVSAGVSLAAAAAPDDASAGTGLKTINHLIFFIHPPVTYSYHRLLKPAPDIAENCMKIAREKSGDKAAAVCIFQSNKGDKQLVDAAKEAFGDRCIVDPNDNSEATRAMLAGDADRAFSRRGNHGEWNIYEMWSSNNGRRWAEGLKKTLQERGYALDPGETGMESFGSWSGCHHKYSNFMAAYLDLKGPAHIHADTALCTHKGWPMEVTAFDECIPMDRNVLLFIVRRSDGCPMAQYWDGRRPFYERPHTATVRYPASAVDLFSFTPNSLIPYDGESRKSGDGFTADVGDGCRPAYTTIVGRSSKEEDYQAFRDALAGAEIRPCEGPPGVMYAVEV